MSFKELNLQREYRSFKNDIVNEFYIPVLKEAVLYRRAVGFFSSTALSEIAKGVASLIEKGGRIELIASPRLSEEDMEAMEKGYKLRRQIIEERLLSELTEAKDYLEGQRLNLLAHLIADNKLEIKIAILNTKDENGIGIYHEKLGIIYDNLDNKIAFSGSLNETGNALRVNYESIDVFTSWKDEERVDDKEKVFNRIWDNVEDGLEVLEFPNLKNEISKRYKKDYINSNFENNSTIYDANSDYYVNTNIPCIPDTIKLHDYQVEAIENWKLQNYRGIFDMATGTGKTFTGLGAVARLYEQADDQLAVIIVCPYQHLVEQWVEDIVKFNMNPIIGYSASIQKDWKRRLDNAIRDQKLKVRNKEFFCFICTNATFASEYVQKQINKIRSNALLIVDEAHNFGSENMSKLLSEKFNYRLALSATIDRHNDEEGTSKLFSYFGDKCIQYSLEKAINEKKLTRYKYYPIITTLNDIELERYIQITYEINKCLVKDRNGKLKLNEKGKILALARARLVAGAEDKVFKLKDYIMPYIEDKHILVYCGATKMLKENQDFTDVDNEDLRQIDVVTDLLGNKLNMKVSQFTSKEDVSEREILKKEFKEGNTLQALIAIKCLDEGVNIPKIKVAFILASTTNPKEYIQRRGRVLRLAEGKDFAEIYDFITIPRPLDEVHSLTEVQMKKELTLVKNELNRAIEFSRIAMNMVEAESVLDEIREAYSINDYMFTLEGDLGYGS